MSEPKAFSHDLHYMMRYFPSYCFFLNSEDRYDEDLPLLKNQAFGGTMIFWKKSLDSFVSVYSVTTSSFLPIIFSPPGAPVSVHIALYLPTSGLEAEFLEQIALLRIAIEELKETHPEALFFLRGDSNVNKNNKNRVKLLENLCSTLHLKNIPTNHNTYHHFIGNGSFDSSIDVIIQSEASPNEEVIEEVLCQSNFPEIDSHHDIILSTVSIPVYPSILEDAPLTTAPRIQNTRNKIIWGDDKIPEYEAELAIRLAKIRKDWFFPNSPSSVSILLDLTNQIMSHAAAATNEHVALITVSQTKSLKIPLIVKKAQQTMNKAHKGYKEAMKTNKKSVARTREAFNISKRLYRLEQRRQKHKEDCLRDSPLFSVTTSNPSAVYKSIRSAKSSSSRAIPFLTVGKKKYVGENIVDGFYDSISALKSQDNNSLQSSPNYNSWSQDYEYILQMCKNKCDIPLISLEKSSKILLKMKSSVNDFWSITPLHFINAGTGGKTHFNFLMNLIILDINNATVLELNTVYALLLHKGHGKPRTSDRSYRTISNCPVVAKALDIYIHDLFIKHWNGAQADTQYQGEGSSHELASLLKL